MLSKKVPLHYLLVSTIVASAFTYAYIKHVQVDTGDASEITASTSVSGTSGTESENPESAIGIKRLSGYKYVAPIIAAGPVNESAKYANLKHDISDLIDRERKTGQVTNVSVYLKNFQTSNWTVINPDERYSPGSLLKVAVMTTYLKMSESMPGLLNKEVVYHGDRRFHYPTQHYMADSVKEGHKYTVNDLIRYMIKYSDNKSTLFLENNMDTTIFKKQFSELGLKDIHFDDANYTLNVREYSRLMKALYNAGYLGAQSSEFAISMLTESNFRDGIVKELPREVTVAHKFGEAGDGQNHELHESGIVYLAGSPYLLTIMTRGADWGKLSETISHISKLVYDRSMLPADGHPIFKTESEK